MKISVITATYNREKTITRALESLYKQTYQNYEHIIIDGASTDNTLFAISQIIREGTKIISEKDNGIYDAFNKGISICTGDIIGFLHSDDMYYDNFVLEKISSKFVELPNIHGVYGNTVFTNTLSGSINRLYRSPRFSEKNMSRGMMPSHTSLYLKHEVYRQKGLYDTSYKISGDFEFLCRLVKDPNIILYGIDKIFTSMLNGGASTSLQNKIALNREFILACKKNRIDTSVFRILSRYPIKYINEILPFIITTKTLQK